MPSRESSLRNLEKARENWRPPRPWRSGQETRVIKRLVWQWFNCREPRKWSGRAVARWLDVTHTYVEKLVGQFRRDPSEMLRDERLHTPATFEQLEHAREETRKERAGGRLREPPKWMWKEFKVGSTMVRAVVPTKAKERRMAAEAKGRALGPMYVAFRELPDWATGMPYCPAQNRCDPCIAARAAMQPSQRLRPLRFARRIRRQLAVPSQQH